MIRSVLMSAPLAAGLAGSATAETITVCAKGCDYTSIQDAINAASNGDVIQLADDLFVLDDPIYIQGKGVTIIGGAETRTALDGSALVIGAMVRISGNGEPVRFEGLRIEGNRGTGVTCEGLGSPLFVDCEFTGLERGVDATNGCGPDFYGCVFLENNSGDSSVLIRGTAMELNGSETIIEGCIFSGNITPPFNQEDVAAVKATTSTSLIIRDSIFCENFPADIAGHWQDDGGNSFSLVCTEPCAGDINQDGEVDAADLGLLTAAWGTDGSIVAGSDLDGDGLVRAGDLGLLLGYWGPCD